MAVSGGRVAVEATMELVVPPFTAVVVEADDGGGMLGCVVVLVLEAMGRGPTPERAAGFDDDDDDGSAPFRFPGGGAM